MSPQAGKIFLWVGAALAFGLLLIVGAKHLVGDPDWGTPTVPPAAAPRPAQFVGACYSALIASPDGYPRSCLDQCVRAPVSTGVTPEHVDRLALIGIGLRGVEGWTAIPDGGSCESFLSPIDPAIRFEAVEPAGAALELAEGEVLNVLYAFDRTSAGNLVQTCIPPGQLIQSPGFSSRGRDFISE